MIWVSLFTSSRESGRVMPDKKDIAKLIRQIGKWDGWTIQRRSKGWIAYPADKTQPPIAIHGTYSDHRSYQNTISQLRRAGAPI